MAGRNSNSPKVLNMDTLCPSCKDIQESYSKLKKMCMSGEFVINTLLDHLCAGLEIGISDLTLFKEVGQDRCLGFQAQVCWFEFLGYVFCVNKCFFFFGFKVTVLI